LKTFTIISGGPLNKHI